MSGQLGYLGALLGGALALASPCSALLLPAFFAYAFGHPARLLARTGVFYLGLATTLVPLGAAAASLGGLLTAHRQTVIAVAAVLLIVFGTAQLFGRGFGSGLSQRFAATTRISSAVSVYVLGATYGLAGFCSGPILGGVLTVAAAGGDPGYGAALLAVYGLGMVLPLFVLATLWDRLKLGERSWLRGREVSLGRLRLHSTNLVAGLLFIGIGVLFLLTDGTAALPGIVSVDTESALAERAGELAAGVPDLLVLLPVLAVATTVLVWRLRKG
ncbi:cytochrome c biogenesis CcdA family protein [Crossiella sp. SN42]|uniref:cytochrome c biogenesis CcdA family protein n=1 Tax=Crossiella sp. SN42 TaxID=2944808 RepID=UPI00207CDC83|nr:cytochrome c biogenesis CcdA family protein [Crossiella sp. SN42]MCO1577768.1 cytochrome c biogenesis CcdA family protein [Crossiella sp. SN42]